MTSPDFRRDSAIAPADPVRALQVARITDFADATREMQEMRQLVETLAEAVRRLLANSCPRTGNPSHRELVEFWESEKSQGRGEADDMLFALAAIAKATGSNP